MFQSALQGMQQVSWWGGNLSWHFKVILPAWTYILWLVVNPTHNCYDIRYDTLFFQSHKA
jgi:hypothetical protein